MLLLLLIIVEVFIIITIIVLYIFVIMGCLKEENQKEVVNGIFTNLRSSLVY